MIRLQIRNFSSPAPEAVSCSQCHYCPDGSCHLQRRVLSGEVGLRHIVMPCQWLPWSICVLGFRSLPESIEAWFYILLATHQFLLWTQSVFPVFSLLGIPVRYLPQGIFCRAVTLDNTLEGTKSFLMSTLAPTFATIE